MSVCTTDGHRHSAAVDVGERLGEHRFVGIVEPHAAVFHRLAQTEQTELAHLAKDLVCRKDLGCFPFVHVWIHLLGDPSFDGISKLCVLVCQLHRRGRTGVGRIRGERPRTAPSEARAPRLRGIPQAPSRALRAYRGDRSRHRPAAAR